MWTTLGKSDFYGLTQKQFWRLVKFEAEHDPDRMLYYEQLEELEYKRKREEWKRRALERSPDPERLTLDEVLSRLEGVRRSGRGWIARCPVHEDRNASMKVSEGEAGEVLMRCHAGCEFVDIIRTIKSR